MKSNFVQFQSDQISDALPSIQTGMYSLVICIPTYKRPLMLKKLIVSIISSNINMAIIKDVNIIVMDNDIDKTAEKIVQGLQKKSYGISKLHYFNYDRKGLANVRNKLFKTALEYNPDFIVGIDDDEYVTTEWLNELVSTIISTNGDIAVAPYHPVFEPQVPSYISYWFKHPSLTNNESIKFFHAGNYIICCSFLLQQKIEFDPRFNTTGAEDTFFGVTAMKKGGKIYWAKKAIAYEIFDKNRACLNWLIKRRFRSAITYTYILILEKEYYLLLKKIVANIIYLVSGIIALLLFPVKFKYRYWGVLKLAESFGGFAALVNIKFHEYQKGK